MTEPKKSEALQFAMAVAKAKLPDLEAALSNVRERRARELAQESEQSPPLSAETKSA